MRSNMEEKLLLDVKEVCKLTGLCEKSVRKILNNPRYHFTVKIGRRVFVHRKKFENWLESKTKK